MLHHLQAGVCEEQGSTEINDLQLPGMSPQSLQRGVLHAAAGVHAQHLQAWTACCHSSIACIGDIQAPAGRAGQFLSGFTTDRHPTTEDLFASSRGADGGHVACIGQLQHATNSCHTVDVAGMTRMLPAALLTVYNTMLQQAAGTLQAVPRQVDINQATARSGHSPDASICDPLAPAQV